MSSIRKLASQTAIYGLSSIVGRFLNYLLVPLYTYKFAPEAYGIVTELYAYAAFLFVIFTYGMETAFFRYFEKENRNAKVYSTALLSILISSTLLFFTVLLLSGPIASALKYPQHSDFIIWIGLITALDAITSIPFARLRALDKALKFVSIKLVNIGLNIGFNLFFLLLLPHLVEEYSGSFIGNWADQLYNPEFGIGYIFISNLIASGATLLLLSPQIIKVNLKFDRDLWRFMLHYALPLVLVGFAGIINETLDRILLKFFLPYDANTNQAMIGIYGACYKLSLLMTLFIQAYRYAAEPFFFSMASKENSKSVYASTLRYFVIVGACIFLGIMLFIDIIKYFIGPEYHEGLVIVPILLMANLFLGIYYTLSIWYKLSDRTKLGAVISVGGALITILLNILLIPRIGYLGSAWATLACYGSMSLASYFFGQRYYPVNYNIPKVSFYIIFSLVIYLISFYLIAPNTSEHSAVKYALNILLFICFLAVVFFMEKPNLKAITPSKR